MSMLNKQRDLIDCIKVQLEELEMLESMFPSENELEFFDPTLLIDVKEYIKSNGKSAQNLRSLNFNVNLDVDVECSDLISVCISVLLPSLYPSIPPNISITSNSISRNSKSLLDQDLNSFLLTLEKDQIILIDVISWIQENLINYYTKGDHENESIEPSNVNMLLSEIHYMWLYMHHIYSKNKRKDIINWATELELTGFSLPGKPGVVYIEGRLSNIDEYFERLRRLNWKRLSCKIKDKCDTRVFDCFNELSFDCHGGRDYHMDMGKFYTFLIDNKLGHFFKELFGIEGHIVEK